MKYLIVGLLLLFASPAFAENEGYVVLLEKGYVVAPHAVITIEVKSGIRDGVYVDHEGVAHKAVMSAMSTENRTKGYYIRDTLEIDKDIPTSVLREWEWMKEFLLHLAPMRLCDG